MKHIDYTKLSEDIQSLTEAENSNLEGAIQAAFIKNYGLSAKVTVRETDYDEKRGILTVSITPAGQLTPWFTMTFQSPTNRLDKSDSWKVSGFHNIESSIPAMLKSELSNKTFTY